MAEIRLSAIKLTQVGNPINFFKRDFFDFPSDLNIGKLKQIHSDII